MPTREGSAHWKGTLKDGEGTVRTESGALDAHLTFGSRFEDAAGANPEELIGAAFAGCFSMAFSKLLADAGNPPENIHTRAMVTLEKVGDGFGITKIHLHTRGKVPGISEEEFQRRAATAKEGCPVSKALAVPEVTLQAELAN
jgi:osmotically inducible protein OsmC